MAYTKIIVIGSRLDKCIDYVQNKEKTSLANAIRYALNRDKTERTCFESAVNCELECAHADMLNTKRRWKKAGQDHVQGYHIIQSFAPGETTPEEAHAIGVEFAHRLLGSRYEVVVTTHLDREHLHNHVVFNSVSFMDGRMYRNNFRDYFGGDGIGIRGTSDTLCREHDLSVIEPTGKGKQYSEWEAEQTGRPTIRGMIRQDIDAIIGQSYTYKSFWEQLRRQGYQVKSGPNVKHTAIQPPGGKKYIRLDSLGEGYTEADIQARLAAIRSGEAPPPNTSKPPSPASIPWLTPGRRYRVQGGISRYRPRKLTGFRALYFKYLYLLGAVPTRRPRNRAAFLLREEIIKFDRYQKQFSYLMKNHIETETQLSMQYDALQAEIDALTDQRRDLYNAKRAGRLGEDAAAEIPAITARLRELRWELKLCIRIEGDLPTVRAAVQYERPDSEKRRTPNEKTDPSRPDRHFSSGAGVPAHRDRAH
ncbi:MAG: relaxase/mobilization nuclease domain-containing protein [Lawsonibacter sp.]|jgi:hypothetical protein|nr:relaxase/mobilization nuclease domain-containing protein [Lawsonibacter sp.]